MAKHRIRLFDRFRLDASLRAGGNCDLFLHFLGFDGSPHVTVFSEPNPRGGGDRLTPHFTRWQGVFRRTLTRLPLATVRRFVDDFTRTLVDHFVRALSPVDLAELEADGWALLDVPHTAVDAWLARTTRHGETILNQTTLADLFDAMAGGAICHRPTQYVPRVAALVAAVRPTADDGLEFMHVTYCPDGFGVRGEDGAAELVHPPGWYRVERDWWPEAEQRSFYERWFGPGLTKVRKLVSTIQRDLNHRP